MTVGRWVGWLLAAVLGAATCAGDAFLESAVLSADQGTTPGRGGGIAGAVGRLIVAARSTMVRTKGSGNLSVDLPRGRTVVLRGISGDMALLAPAPADADILRQFGVRRVPVYKVPRSQLEEDFVTLEAWQALREESTRRIRERWPGLAPLEVERILLGDPFVGMSVEQAEEAVGSVVFSREGRDGPRGKEEVWRIGRRPRTAELRQFTEGRERGVRTRTFEEYLVFKTRALLRFRDGILIEISAPGPERSEGRPGGRSEGPERRERFSGGGLGTLRDLS